MVLTSTCLRNNRDYINYASIILGFFCLFVKIYPQIIFFCCLKVEKKTTLFVNFISKKKKIPLISEKKKNPVYLYWKQA